MPSGISRVTNLDGTISTAVVSADAAGNVLNAAGNVTGVAGGVSPPIPTFSAAQAASSNSSGSVANAAAVATLPATAGKTWYVTHYGIDAGGATAGTLVLATITGLLGGTKTRVIAVPAGTMLCNSLTTPFPIPLQAAGVNTAVVLTLPACGVGNLNAAVTIDGFLQ